MKLINNNSIINYKKVKNNFLIIAITILLLNTFITSLKTTTNTNTYSTNKNKNLAMNMNKFNMKMHTKTNTKSKTSIFESFKSFYTNKNRNAPPSPPTTTSSSNSNNSGNTLNNKNTNIQDEGIFGSDGDIDIGGGPIFWEGWVKFFRFLNDDNKNRPQAFYKNPEFISEKRNSFKKRNPNGNKTPSNNGQENVRDTAKAQNQQGTNAKSSGDSTQTGNNDGNNPNGNENTNTNTSFLENSNTNTYYSYNPDQVTPKPGPEKEQASIPNDSSFWGILYADEFVVAKSKKKAFTTVYDVLKIDYISPISEEKSFKGGIMDFGSFKEGDCFKIKTNQSGRWIWIICTEKPQAKLKLMSTFKKMVVKHQRDNGFINSPQEQNDEKQQAIKDNSTASGPGLDNKKSNIDKDQPKDSSTDGHWIKLQDWSSCTKKCGGGTQSLHRMCVPPKQNGSPCEGKAILTKPCNNKPCPKTTEKKEEMNPNETLIAPTMHIMPFSNRPQRYDKCHLKESDLLLTTKSEQNGNPHDKRNPPSASQVPVRVVMNMRTLTAYAGNEYTDQKVSFDLLKVKFFESTRDKSCFVIKENGNVNENSPNPFKTEAEFCPFGLDLSESVRNEWDYDFSLFKYQCHLQKDVKKPEDDPEIQDELNKKKNQAELSLINQKKNKLEEKEKEDLAQQEKVKKNSLKAIQKEMKLEEMIEAEEKEREQDEENIRLDQLQKEKNKSECLNRAIKEKELENQYNIKKLENKNNLSSLQNGVANEIRLQRDRLKKRIKELKMRSNAKKGNIDQEIMNIRLEMANTIANRKKGNVAYCIELTMKHSRGESEAKFEASMQGGNLPDGIKTMKDYCEQTFTQDAETRDECLEGANDKASKKFLEICCDHETEMTNPEEYKNCMNSASPPSDGKVSDDLRFFWGKQYYKSHDGDLETAIDEQTKENDELDKKATEQQEGQNQKKP